MPYFITLCSILFFYVSFIILTMFRTLFTAVAVLKSYKNKVDDDDEYYLINVQVMLYTRDQSFK